MAAQEMHVEARLDQGLSFQVTTGSGHLLTLDSGLTGQGKSIGPTPMELLLAGLAGCSGMSVISILHKKRQQITHYEIRVHGKRAPQPPHEFTIITVEHIFAGHDLQPEAIERALALTEERYCGVSAMLEEAAEIRQSYRILADKL